MYSHSTFPAQPNNKPKDISDTTLGKSRCILLYTQDIYRGLGA